MTNDYRDTQSIYRYRDSNNYLYRYYQYVDMYRLSLLYEIDTRRRVADFLS